jgi:flagellar P-ring protein precursor FlgI
MRKILRHILAVAMTAAVLSSQIVEPGFAQAPPPARDRVKDMVSIGGVRSNQLVGYGIVVGLNGTGDGNVEATRQTVQSLLQRFGMSIPQTNFIDAKNVAAVMVTAELPPFAKPGQKIDITVSSMGKASSLRGGSLLITQLVGADNETYAVAQGNLAVGGLGITGKDGSTLTVNIPTVGRIPDGATVERTVASPFETAQSLMLNLNSPDFTNAMRLAAAVNGNFGAGTATAIDATTVKVIAPRDLDRRVSFMAAIEDLMVTPSAPPARVIVNSRTGTIVISEGVRVTPAAVSHGSLTVRIKENLNVSQPNAGAGIGGRGNTNAAGQTVVTPDSQIVADQAPVRTFLFAPDVQLASIVDAVNAVGASPSDLVAILEALKQAGALHADLIVI